MTPIVAEPSKRGEARQSESIPTWAGVLNVVEQVAQAFGSRRATVLVPSLAPGNSISRNAGSSPVRHHVRNAQNCRGGTRSGHRFGGSMLIDRLDGCFVFGVVDFSFECDFDAKAQRTTVTAVMRRLTAGPTRRSPIRPASTV